MSIAPLRFLLAACLLAPPILSGTQHRLTPGDRLRIRDSCEVLATSNPCQPLIGQLHSALGDTLVLTDNAGQDRRVLLAPTTRVDVSQGTHGHALAGLAIGTALGAVAGLALSESCGSTNSEEDYCALWYLVTVPTGMVAGLIGGALARTERWRTTDAPRASIRFEPTLVTPGVAVRAQLRF